MPVIFTITVKRGVDLMGFVEGRPLADKQVTIEDCKKVIEVEQYLERITGLRFHIEMGHQVSDTISCPGA